MASGPSAPSLWHRTFSTAWAPLSKTRPPRRSARVRHWRWYTTRSLSGRPSSIRLLRAREGPARGLHGKSAQGFGQIAIGNAANCATTVAPWERDCRTLYATGPDATTPRADSGTGRVNHHSEAVSSTSACAEWLHLDPAFDAVGRSDAAQLDQIRRRRVGGCGSRHVVSMGCVMAAIEAVAGRKPAGLPRRHLGRGGNLGRVILTRRSTAGDSWAPLLVQCCTRSSAMRRFRHHHCPPGCRNPRVQ